MDDKERFARGMAVRRKVLGNAWVDRANARKTVFTEEFQEFITRCAWGEVWTRPHFDERTRRILVIGTTIALGRWEEFRLHTRAALTEGGFSADDIKEIILQQAIYCGVPAANHAFREATEALAGWRRQRPADMPRIKIRTGMPSVQLSKEEFAKRLRNCFADPAFDGLGAEIDRIVETAWDGYDEYRKSPRTRPAGPGYADPMYELSDEWREANHKIKEAERRQKNSASPSRILLINGASRSEHSCPGEMSKTFRLVTIARDIMQKARGFEVELLDLSRLTSEYGRVIHPCKTCVSTAMPLCHWPCSCYPNHALGQVNDWMNEIYPMWVAAHGVMIVCPVNWYQAPSTLKLMIDRLVCADGGNPDPTSTGGKDAKRAKALELKGWHYPRHLAGRTFAVVVHGDAAGVGTLRRSLADWLMDIGMIPAGHLSQLGAYIGYLAPYATSHDDLDRDRDAQEDMRNTARALVQAVKQLRCGELKQPDAGLHPARPK
jgi:4-carboxymuconolactone decarboxylase